MARGDVVARIVRSDGREFIIGDGNWRILKNGLENWANLPYKVYSAELPAMDGAIITSKRVASVDRTIEAECRGNDPDRLRAEAIEFFNPKYSFEAHMSYRGRTRWCAGEQIGFKASEGNMYQRPTLMWTILCPNPYLQSESNFGKDIAEVAPMMGFPWVSALPKNPITGEVNRITNKYAVFSAHTFSRTVGVINKGDVESSMKIEIYANGKVTNPWVKQGDGFVKLLATLDKGDHVIFDMTQRPPVVTLNGRNAMHLLDRTSSVLNLVVETGPTTIEYDADFGNEAMSVTVYWNEQYLGL